MHANSRPPIFAFRRTRPGCLSRDPGDAATIYIKAIKAGHYRDMQLRYLENKYDHVDDIWPQQVSEDRHEPLATFREGRKPAYCSR